LKNASLSKAQSIHPSLRLGRRSSRRPRSPSFTHNVKEPINSTNADTPRERPPRGANLQYCKCAIPPARTCRREAVYRCETGPCKGLNARFYGDLASIGHLGGAPISSPRRSEIPIRIKGLSQVLNASMRPATSALGLLFMRFVVALFLVQMLFRFLVTRFVFVAVMRMAFVMSAAAANTDANTEIESGA